MAAHLALMGFEVALYNRTPDHIHGIQARKGIDLEGGESGPHGFARLALVTSDMKEAVLHADVLMVVVPSSAHAGIAAKHGTLSQRRTNHHSASRPNLRGDRV